MKKLTPIIFVLNLLMTISAWASEGGVKSKSQALFEVISTIEAARYDLPVFYEIEEASFFNNVSEAVCLEVQAFDVLEAFWDMLDAYQEVFPDEELPYEQAVNDFAALVGEGEFMRCESVREEVKETVRTVSFTSLNSDNSFKVTFLHHLVR